MSSKNNKYKTILERETIAGNLLKFLAPSAPINAYENEQRNTRLSKKSYFLVNCITICTILIGFLASHFIEAEQNYIHMVQSGTHQTYVDVSYGDAFGAFFTDCNWRYFKSKQDQNVVEFHGNACYYDEMANFAMQFVISANEQTFELYVLTINNELKPDLMKALILTEIFENYGKEDNMKIQSDKKESVTIENEIDITETVDEDDNKIERANIKLLAKYE